MSARTLVVAASHLVHLDERDRHVLFIRYSLLTLSANNPTEYLFVAMVRIRTLYSIVNATHKINSNRQLPNGRP